MKHTEYCGLLVILAIQFLDCTTIPVMLIPVMLTLLFEAVRKAPTRAKVVAPKYMWSGSPLPSCGLNSVDEKYLPATLPGVRDQFVISADTLDAPLWEVFGGQTYNVPRNTRRS